MTRQSQELTSEADSLGNRSNDFCGEYTLLPTVDCLAFALPYLILPSPALRHFEQ
jgi:hypothetical protein